MEAFFGPQNCMYLARILALVFAIPMHEVAHALVSDKLGDHTARDLGRLTLNPIKHFDPLGLLSMLIIGVGWAKPVPVNPGYYKNRKVGMAVTSFAGPASNLLLAFVVMIIYKVFLYGYFFSTGLSPTEGALWASVVFYVLYYFILINISLALFNLIPIPPLDGSRILGLILPEKLYFGIMKYERYIMFGLLALMVVLPRLTGFSPIGWLLGPLSSAVMNGMYWLTGFVDMLFGI